MPMLVVCDSASLCPYLYKALSVPLYDLYPCLEMFLFYPWPVGFEHQHRYATGHAITNDHDVILEMPFTTSLESAKFATVYHGAMRIAFRFM